MNSQSIANYVLSLEKRLDKYRVNLDKEMTKTNARGRRIAELEKQISRSKKKIEELEERLASNKEKQALEHKVAELRYEIKLMKQSDKWMDEGGYKAYAKVGKRQMLIGTYKTKEEAALAEKRAVENL